MCVKHVRFCRDCNKTFTIYRGCVPAGYLPVLLCDSVCLVSDCSRRCQRVEGTPCTFGPCSSASCTPATCRLEIVYLTCSKNKKNVWKYIVRP